MTRATHYVIDNLLGVLDKEGDELGELFEKFATRYPDDEELQAIYQEFKSDKCNLEEVKKKLKELHDLRAVEESGGGPDRLPMKDRRHF